MEGVDPSKILIHYKEMGEPITTTIIPSSGSDILGLNSWILNHIIRNVVGKWKQLSSAPICC